MFFSVKSPDRLWDPPSLLLDECPVKRDFNYFHPCALCVRGVNRENLLMTFDVCYYHCYYYYLVVFVKSIVILQCPEVVTY
jgi:hypothetical protein